MRHSRSLKERRLQKGGGGGGSGGGGGTQSKINNKSIFKSRKGNEQDYEKLSSAINQFSSQLSANYKETATSILQALKFAPESVTVIRDKQGNAQAFLVAETKEKGGQKYNYVEFVLTAPWNAASNSKDPRKVKGAGTEAIKVAIKQSKKNGGEGRLLLNSADEAIPFYKKLGFKQGKYVENVTPMGLSKDSAEKLLRGT